MAREYPALLDLVGRTPIVRLDKLGRDIEPTLLAKLEHLNPGASAKDRIRLPLIASAVREGKLRPRRTIAEPTSGYTTVGLSLPPPIIRYRCSFVVHDKI